MRSEQAAARHLHCRLPDRRAAIDDRGFTLVEVLVVVVIIGVLTAIAVPLFLGQQQAAHRAAVETDVHHLGVELETVAAKDNGVYSAPDPAIIQSSDGVTMNLRVAASGQYYYVTATNIQLGGGTTTFYYTNLDGGSVGWSDDTGFTAPIVPAVTEVYGT